MTDMSKAVPDEFGGAREPLGALEEVPRHRDGMQDDFDLGDLGDLEEDTQ